MPCNILDKTLLSKTKVFDRNEETEMFMSKKTAIDFPGWMGEAQRIKVSFQQQLAAIVRATPSISRRCSLAAAR